MDPAMFYDSGNHDKNSPRNHRDEVSDRLLRVPLGHHCIVLYPNLETVRNIYSKYVRAQIEEDPDAIILLLPYYETTESVRDVLNSKGINVRERERQGSLIIVDVVKAVTNPDVQSPATERFLGFIRQVHDLNKDKRIVVVIDMSVFHQLKKSSELLEYERNLHKTLLTEGWKEICLYNERDLESMFTEDEHANELLSYHKDRVIIT
jgi:MEDS: MEthanogen/methylotroph, DcmR Sensory domain